MHCLLERDREDPGILVAVDPRDRADAARISIRDLPPFFLTHASLVLLTRLVENRYKLPTTR